MTNLSYFIAGLLSTIRIIGNRADMQNVFPWDRAQLRNNVLSHQNYDGNNNKT
jgi:hypothetical protein